jgi:hypothetical protein
MAGGAKITNALKGLKGSGDACQERTTILRHNKKGVQACRYKSVLPIKLTMNNNKNDRIARHTLIKN